MTVPLKRILIDPNLPRRIPFYIRSISRRLRKKLLRSIVAPHYPQRLYLESIAISVGLDPDNAHSNDGLLADVSDLAIVLPSYARQVTRPQDQLFLRLHDLPDEQVRARTAFLCHVSNGVLQMNDGVVCTRHMVMIDESALDRHRLMLSSAYGEPKREPPHLKGLYSSIWVPHAENHAHWLFEALQRLYVLQAATDECIVLLMPDNLRPGYQQMLTWCLPSNVTVRYVPRGSWWRTDDFIFASFTVDIASNIMHDTPTHYVRRRILEAVGLEDRSKPGWRRIYISRGCSRIRRVENEKEVFKMLRKYGFESYSLEELDISEQVRLFHEAECVVGAHGAGMANLLFAGAIPFVEFISPHLSPCYFALACILGQEHRWVLARPDSKVRGNRDARTRDFTVPVDDVEQQVRVALQSSLL